MQELTAYERRADFLSSIMEFSTGFSLRTYGNGSYIIFKHHNVEGYYRGEDSGARYAEYSAAIDDATFYIHSVLDKIYYNETIGDLAKRLQSDHAEWVPIGRHKKMVSFLLENPHLLENSTDQFEHAIKKINAYYDLDFVFSFKEMWKEKTLNVVRYDQVLASYNVNDVYYNLPGRCSSSRFPCYKSLSLMWFLNTHPEYLIHSNDYDGFELIKR